MDCIKHVAVIIDVGKVCEVHELLKNLVGIKDEVVNLVKVVINYVINQMSMGYGDWGLQEHIFGITSLLQVQVLKDSSKIIRKQMEEVSIWVEVLIIKIL